MEAPVDLIKSDRGPSKRPISFEFLQLSEIKDNPNNARRHDRRQIAKLCRSIRKFGFTSPAVIDEANQLLCGHARVAAARLLGLDSIPVVRATHLSEADKRAFMIADNRLAELATWDQQALRRELSFLSDLDIDYDFSPIGLDTGQVDFIIDGGMEADDRADTLPSVPDVPVSKPCDLWLMGEHRVVCGSALDPSSYRALMGDEKADMVFTDPPYNVPIDGHTGGKGTVKHREFAMASGEMSIGEYAAFLSAFIGLIGAIAQDGAICFVCIDWRHVGELLTAGKALTLKNICVWVKTNAGMGSLYRSQHEFVFVFKCGAANHINNVELGKHGRNRSNVWEYRGINSFGPDRDELLKSHPTVKPVALVADAIRDCSHRGDLILDPFGGSGTTLIAAEKTKRRSALIEIDPVYVDVIVRRWEAFTGKQAVCAASGLTFAQREAGVGQNMPDGGQS